MSPRFDRRPEKRSAPSPSWRRSGGARRDGLGRGGVGRGGPIGRGAGARSESRPDPGTEFRPDPRSETRSDFRSERRLDRRSGEGRRPQVRRPDGSPAEGGRPQRPAPGRRSETRRPFSSRAGSGAGGGAGAGTSGRWDAGRGPRRLVAPRPDRAGRPLRPAAALLSEQPAGESERFGQEPADDLVWGRHSAQAALESGRPIHRIWCTPEMRFSPRFLQLLREAKASGVLVEEVTWARLGQISGGAVHQGIVLQTAAADTLDLATLIEGCRALSEPALLLAVDGLTDPHNLGAIVRSGESLGAHGLVLPQRRNAGLTGTVAKVAAGALEHLPVARVVNLNRALETLRQEGYRIIGLAEEGSVGLHEADLEGPLVVVTGSEGSGLSLLTRRHCDQLVRIPLRGATPSLNASVATGLLLYEIARRGWMKGVHGTSPAPRLERPLLPAQPPLQTGGTGPAEPAVLELGAPRLRHEDTSPLAEDPAVSLPDSVVSPSEPPAPEALLSGPPAPQSLPSEPEAPLSEPPAPEPSLHEPSLPEPAAAMLASFDADVSL